MKTMKRLAALLLTLCLLIGLPISVSAVGSTTPSDLRLIGVQPFIKGEVGVGNGIHSNSTWGDRGMILYFNQTLAKFDSTVRIKMLVVDAEDKVVTYGGKKLAWTLGSHGEEPWVFRGYMVALFDMYGITYNDKTVLKWADIIDLLANAPELAGKGYRLQVRIYDSKSTSDGLVDICTAASGGTKLTATGNDTVDSAKYMSGDFAAVDLGTVAAGATTVTRTGVVTLDRVELCGNGLVLSYSEAVSTRTDVMSAGLEVISATGSVITTFGVTMTTAQRGYLSNSKTAADVQAVIDANAGSYARLKITEKNLVAERDERFNNFAVDTVWGTESGRPLLGEYSHVPVVTDKVAKTADYVFCPVTMHTDAPMVTGVAVTEILDNNDVKMVVTFSEPVTFSGSSWDIIMRYNTYSNGSGQKAHGALEYLGGTTVGGKTYASQVRVTFKGAAPLNANVGVAIVEYNHHTNSHGGDALVGPTVFADVDGNGLRGTHLTECTNANTNCVSAPITVSYTFATMALQTLQDKLAEGGTVALTENTQVESLQIPANATLDLNGFTLTCDRLLSTGGQVTDSSGGKGGIAIEKNDLANESHLLVLAADNAALPLYDTAFGGYRFFTCTAAQHSKTDVCKFGFQLALNEDALSLLADAANADVELKSVLEVTVDGQTVLTKDYVFKAETLAKYALKRLEEPTKNWAIVLTVGGLDALEGESVSISSTPTVGSSTGVSIAPESNATATFTR